jgi:hypothetical protein
MQRPVILPLLLCLTCVTPLALGAVRPNDDSPPSVMSRIGAPEARELVPPILGVIGSLLLDFSRTETRSAEPQRHLDARRKQALPRHVARRSRPQQHPGGMKRYAAFLKPLKITARLSIPSGGGGAGSLNPIAPVVLAASWTDGMSRQAPGQPISLGALY